MPFRFFRGGSVFGPLIARRRAAERPSGGNGRNAPRQAGGKKEQPQKEKPKQPGEDARRPRHVRTDVLELSGLTKKEIYRERVFARTASLFLATGAVISGLLAVSVPGGEPQMEAIRSLVVFLAVLFFFFLLNFSFLSIRATFDDIVVRFGVFNFKAEWADVIDIRVERERDGAKKYYGIRMINIPEGLWRIVYSAGLPRVILRFREGSIRELSFTTLYPEKVMTVANECARRKQAQEKKLKG